MIDINIEAGIKEIKFNSDSSCVFVIETEDKKELLCTITRNNIELVKLVKEGQEVKINGNIAACRRVRGDKEFIDNTFYVSSLEHVVAETIKKGGRK